MSDHGNTEKREAAMRLFGALSGVDEAYLEASESAGGGKLVPFGRLAGFRRRYGRLVAAVLVLCVLGAGYAGVRSLEGGSVNNMATQNLAEDSAPALVQEEASMLSESTNSDEAFGTARSESKKNGMPDAEDLYAYLPRNWPEDSNVSVERLESEAGLSSADAALRACGTYPSSGESFEIRIQRLDAGATAADAKGQIYDAKEFDRNCVEEALKDGAGCFGVLYDAGTKDVLLYYEGGGTVEEVWQLLASVTK